MRPFFEGLHVSRVKNSLIGSSHYKTTHKHIPPYLSRYTPLLLSPFLYILLSLYLYII